jgi:pseudomonalisin
MVNRNIFAIALLVGMAMLAAAPASARAPRVIDDNDRVVLRGNVHPLARPESSLGATDYSLPMERMVFSLRLSPDKQAELNRFISEQQNPASPDFHHWLTPEEFGERFGPATEDIDAVTGWLTSHGFSVDEVAKGRTWINFSGRVADVEREFHTKMHDFSVGGHIRHANARDPEIPRGFADLVTGVVSLHNFPRTKMSSGIRPLTQAEALPEYTTGTSHYLSPADFAAIYNVNVLYGAGIDGTGQSIAIVGRTHPSSSNWTDFRSKMGLPANPPHVIVNGADPGDKGSDEDGEADLDVEWSGAVAKNAAILFVVSKSTYAADGVDLSAQYIVNNNLAPVMSISFGACESQMGLSGNAFYNNLWQQAAAQGITVFVSSGDSGSAGCNGGSDPSGSGQGINGIASTPYNIAVGGTQFNEGSGSYWNSLNSGYTSALGYIPEVAWNESGAAVTCPVGDTCSDLWATGGGASSKYSKPAWQVAPGVPDDGKRDIPDVSLSAAGHDAYLVQTQGKLVAIGGTSAASPSFAGLMALIVQATGQRQGYANSRFYQLAAAQYGSGGAAVFHDITSGNNSVPGVSGYSTTAGYDLATGLGSVDAYNLVNNWAVDFTLTAPTTVTAAQGSSGTATITATVTGGFNTAVALTASGVPTGVTATFSPTSIAAPGSGSTTLTLSAGASTPAGTYSITVTGTGGGIAHTATISFTVTAVPDFTLTAPISVTAALGGSGTAAISTSVTGGFNAAVALTASGAPTGATAAFSPTSIAAPGSGSASLTLSAGASTPSGTYTVTVTGTGGGKTHTATIFFTVASTAIPDGDVDGSGTVDIADALLALKIAANLKIPTKDELAHGDVTPFANNKPAPDGNISITDALMILKKAVQLVNW